MGFEGFLNDEKTVETPTKETNGSSLFGAEKFVFLNNGRKDVWIFASAQEKDQSLVFIPNLKKQDNDSDESINSLFTLPEFLNTNLYRSVLFDASKFYCGSSAHSLDGWIPNVQLNQDISYKIITGLIEMDSHLFLSKIIVHLFGLLSMDKINEMWKNPNTSLAIVQSFLKSDTNNVQVLERCMKKIILIPSDCSLQILNHLLESYFKGLGIELDASKFDHDESVKQIENFCLTPLSEISDSLFQQIYCLQGNSFVTAGILLFVLLFKEQNYSSVDMTVLQTCWMTDKIMKNNSHLISLWSMLKIKLSYACKQMSDVIICPLFQIIDKDNDDPFQTAFALDEKVVQCLEVVFKNKEALIPSWQFFWKLVHLSPTLQVNAVSLITSTTLYCAEAMKINDIEAKIVSALSYRDSHIIPYIMSESVLDLFEKGYDRLGLFLCNREERFFQQLENRKDLVETVLVTLCRFTNKPMEKCGNFIKKLAHIISSPDSTQPQSTNTHNTQNENIVVHIESGEDVVVEEEDNETQTTPTFQSSNPFNAFSSFAVPSQNSRKWPQFVPNSQTHHVVQQSQPLSTKSRRGTQTNSLLDRIMNHPKQPKSMHWLPYPTPGSNKPFFDSVSPYTHSPKHAFSFSPNFE